MFSGLGSYSLWSVGIVLSCFLGLAIGFATRPYIIRHVSFFILTIIITFVYVSNSLNQIVIDRKKRITTTRFIMTWKLLLIIKLGSDLLLLR